MPNKFLQNIKPREYQQKIYETCKDKSCLVVLPTGIGKTLIALMLAIHRLREYPLSKILFLAPTRPLASQHLDYFQKHLPELFATMELFTGKINADKRKKMWQNADIIFSTPQCISNDLKNKLYDLKDVSLLIEDECHRCLKNYSYTHAAKKYHEQSKFPRVLGLTASPGAEKSKIKEITENLGIEAIEVRTRESEDVTEYLQKLKIETLKLGFPAEFEEIRQLLKEIYDKKIEELKNRKLLFGPGNKVTIIELQKKIMRMISTGNKHFNILAGASTCAQAIKIQYCLELLETQTLASLERYMKEIYEQAKQGKSKAVQKLIKDPRFNQAYISICELITKGIENPKLSELKEIIKKEFKIDEKTKKKIKRIIIFSQYRETVTKICKTLNTISGVNARVFIGQAKKSGKDGDTGLTQKEQKEIIHEFSFGKINILASTSVHPKEYIVLKKDDKIIIRKIGEFVDSIIKKDTNKTISKNISGWQALTSDGKNLLFKDITYIHKHAAQNNAIRLKISSGFDCFVTEDHSLFSFNSKNKFVASTPKKNKFVALALKCPNLEKFEKIDVCKEIYENCSKEEINKLFGSLDSLTQAKMRMLKTDLVILSNLKNKSFSIMSLSKLSKRDYSTVSDCLKRLKKRKFITQKRISKNYKNISQMSNEGSTYLKFLEWFFKKVNYQKGKYRFKSEAVSENPSEFNKFFNQNINVNYGKIKFPRFIETNEYLSRFLGFYVSEGSTRKTKFTSDVFLAARNKEMQKMMKESVEKGLKLKTRTNWREIAIGSQIAYHLIKNVFKAGIGSYNKEVPEIIFTANSKIKWEFLRAYYLGDGYSDKNRIVFTTVSRKLVTGLVLLLRMLGIKKITLHKQKNIYRIYVHESLPFAKIKEKDPKRGHAYFSLIPNALSSKRAFEKYSNFYSYNKKNYLKCRKNSQWENDLCFDYIKEVEKVETPKFVYDLSIKNTKNFVGGTGLFCLHNSIGEEGLDIPEVSAVIFYEPVPSAIRQIQRRGRTARLKPGKLIILMLKNTRDEAHYWAAFHKERKMHQAINGLKEEFENNNKEKIKKGQQTLTT